MFPTAPRKELLTSATNIITDICSQKMGMMRHRPQREVDFVASLIENDIPLLTKEWSKILSKHNIRFSAAGIFCHQRPMVRIQSGIYNENRCELVDILFIHSHKRSDQRVFRRAALMQVKRHLKNFQKNEMVQYSLYHMWPNFEIETPGFMRGVRDFAGDQRSGVYGLVDQRSWTVAAPSIPVLPLPGAFSLAEFLVGVLYDSDPRQKGRKSKFGRQFYVTSQFDWSKTIRELITNAVESTFRHTGKIYGNYRQPMPRASSAEYLRFILAQDWLQFTSFGVTPAMGDFDDDTGGRLEPPDLLTEPDERGGLSVLSLATDASAFD